jgi:hypothetical protein
MKKRWNEMKVICIDLQYNVLDLFYEEENFWFVQQRKCLMWYDTKEKEWQYSMDNYEEVLNKRQWWSSNKDDVEHLPNVWCESEWRENEDRACSTICFSVWSLCKRLDK